MFNPFKIFFGQSQNDLEENDLNLASPDMGSAVATRIEDPPEPKKFGGDSSPAVQKPKQPEITDQQIKEKAQKQEAKDSKDMKDVRGDLENETGVKQNKEGDESVEYLYHGTPAVIEGDLRPGNSSHKEGGTAIYLTPDPALASGYSSWGGGLYNTDRPTQETPNVMRFKLKDGTKILNLNEPLSAEEVKALTKHYYSKNPNLTPEEVDNQAEQVAKVHQQNLDDGFNEPAKRFLERQQFDYDTDREILENLGYSGIRNTATNDISGEITTEVAVWSPDVLGNAIAHQNPEGPRRLSREAKDFLKEYKKNSRAQERGQNPYKIKRLAMEAGIEFTDETNEDELMGKLQEKLLQEQNSQAGSPEKSEQPGIAKDAETTKGDEFEPSNLINRLKKVPELAEAYAGSAGVWEGYTVEQHTLMNMGQFEKYFAQNWSSPLISKENFRLMLALHDIGKPLFIKETGGNSAQHEYTLRMMSPILKSEGLSESEIKNISAVVDQDFLGDYVRGRASLEQTAAGIREKAGSIGVSPTELADLIQIFYKCDAGSYTEDAGGMHSLDSLFIFDKKRGEMGFSPNIQQNYDNLMGVLNSKQASLAA